MTERQQRAVPTAAGFAVVLGLLGVTIAVVGAPAAAPAGADRPARAAAHLKAVAGASLGGLLKAPCGNVLGGLECGHTVTGTMSGGISFMSTYSCIPQWLESGPEDVYELTLPPGGPWRVTATVIHGPQIDLDLFVLTPSCDSSSCLMAGDAQLLVDLAGSTSAYLVVDGYEGSAGPYTLEVTCAELGATPEVGVAWTFFGQPGVGGNLPSQAAIWNAGQGEAVGVTVTASGLNYLYDSTALPVVTGTVNGGSVSWQVGTLAPGEERTWTMFSEVDAPLGFSMVVPLTIELGNPTGDDPSNNSSIITMTVETADTDLAVLAEPGWSGPVPGASLPWVVQLCNLGSTSSPTVGLEAAPVAVQDLELESWWTPQEGWLELGAGPEGFNLERGSLAEQECALLVLHSLIAANLAPQHWLCVDLTALTANDLQPGNNQTLGCTQTGSTLFADGFELGTLLWTGVVY